MTWHSISDLKRTDDNKVSANIEIKADSPWFSGHFPGEPVLPGIAQLAMVFETIEQSTGRKLLVSGVSRVRFKRIIKSDDQIELFITPVADNSGAYSFSIMVDKELACSGIMTVHQKGETDNAEEKQNRENHPSYCTNNDR
ncbi:MAG: hypothetical protein GY864_09050 [Desulfobacterales bacterium]|nr:hypothetical protein [Desulfobacterales bacterium]